MRLHNHIFGMSNVALLVWNLFDEFVSSLYSVGNLLYDAGKFAISGFDVKSVLQRDDKSWLLIVASTLPHLISTFYL